MAGEPYRVEGASGGVDKNGIISCRIPWIVSTLEEAIAFVPASAPFGLPLVDRSFSEDKGDIQVTLFYEGKKSGGGSSANGSDETFELEDSTAEQPIDTHPDFEAISKKYKWNDTKKEFEKNISVDGKSRINPLYATTSYLDINAVWRKTYTSDSFPHGLLRSVGCIDQPSGRISPPDLPDGRDWLKRSLKASWRGNVWAITEEWLGAGRYKWNRDIYRVR